MTSLNAVGEHVKAAYEAFKAEQRHARDQYIAAVDTAQRNFTQDIQPAVDTYHSVEQAAWQAYSMTTRAAHRRYLESAGTINTVTPSAPLTPDQAIDSDHGSYPHTSSPARPLFTPSTEG